MGVRYGLCTVYQHDSTLGVRSVDDLLAVAAPGSEPAGELKIGVPPFLSELALETPIDRLRAAFPRLTLRVTAA